MMGCFAGSDDRWPIVRSNVQACVTVIFHIHTYLAHDDKNSN